MRRKRLFLLALIGAVSVPLMADWRQFLPRAVDNGASIELFGSSEADDNRNGDRELVWTDDFLKEKLTLRSAGYVYHPRFLQYQLELAGAVKQEQYDSTALAPLGWRSDTGLEYRAKLFLLPEHPYNLELFALRWEPLFKERSALEHDSLSTSHGADFRYRRKPYFLHARYNDNRLESSQSSSDVERFGADGEYFRQYLNGNKLAFHASVSPTNFSNSAGLDGRSDETLLSNDLEIGPVAVSSSVTRNQLDQTDDGRNRFESDQLSWYERLTAELPWNFRTDLAYRYIDGSSTSTDRERGLRRELSNLDRDVELNVIHRLYDSLQSIFTHRQYWRESDTGRSNSDGNSLSFNYNKRIHRGRVLAGANWTESNLESDGRAQVSSEPHPGVAVPGTITVTRPNIDPATLAVFLRSPIAPFEVVRLTEGLHYVTRQINDSLEITVFALPAQFVVPGSFDLFVSYTLLSGRFELDTSGYGHNASVELLDRLVTPYYSYSHTESDVRSGVFPGSGLNSTTLIEGVRFEKGPLRSRVEHQDVEWDVSPYDAWLADLQYTGTPSPTTTLYGTATFWRRHYPQGLSPLSAIELSPVTEETRSLSGNFQKQLFDRRLVLGLGGSLSRSLGAVDTDAYSIDSSALWRVGRIDLSAGATYYHSASDSPSVPDNRRSHHYFFLKLRRELF